MIEAIDLDTVAQKRELYMSYLYVTPEEYYGKTDDVTATGEMIGADGMWDHIQIVKGRMPDTEVGDDGVIECVMFEQLQKENDILLDKVYVLEDYTNKMDGIAKVKPVGIIKIKDEADPWWTQVKNYTEAFLIDYEYMSSHFLYEKEGITKAQWLYQFDYTKIEIEDLERVVQEITAQDEWFDQYSGVRLEFRALSILEDYFVRAQQLRLTLWVLQSPILIMLAFYIFMVAQLVVENDKNEIAILKSRGSSRFQILDIYFLQSTFLALAACIIGPFLGVFICKVLGAANGFLEFVSRTSLPIKMTPDAILYSLSGRRFFDNSHNDTGAQSF